MPGSDPACLGRSSGYIRAEKELRSRRRTHEIYTCLEFPIHNRNQDPFSGITVRQQHVHINLCSEVCVWKKPHLLFFSWARPQLFPSAKFDRPLHSTSHTGYALNIWDWINLRASRRPPSIPSLHSRQRLVPLSGRMESRRGCCKALGRFPNILIPILALNTA